VGAQGHRCSSTVAGEDEKDEAELKVGSPVHDRWRRGGVTAVEDGGGSSSRVRAEESVRELGREGGSAVVPGGPGGLYRGQGRVRKVATGGNRWRLMVLTPFMVGQG
jgi:hypothetical protein